MNLKLADNIKKYRKRMELTQEGLADAIGVTVGAVCKWEKGSNIPDILTMMELADLFDISMDELVGYEISSKKLEDMCQRIDELSFQHKHEEAIREANEAMLRYPHNFRVLYTCAEMYFRKTMENFDEGDAGKAIGIYQTALNCISQNKDPEISEYSIKYRLANMYSMFDPKMALEILRKINFEGCRSNEIAVTLLELGKTNEALENFSYALVRNFTEQTILSTNTAWAIVTSGKKSDLKKAIELLDAQITFTEAYSYRDKLTEKDKVKLIPMITKACLYSVLGEEKEMVKWVQKTRRLADEIDKVGVSREIADFFKFYFTSVNIPVYDACGDSAVESVDTYLSKRAPHISGKKHGCVNKVIECWNQNSN